MTDRVKLLGTVLGVIYMATGVIGFAFTGFDNWVTNGTDAILIFEINPFHNIVHIGTGALWLLAGQLPKRQSAEGIHQGIAIIYVVATLLGALGWLTFLSIDGLTAPDNLLHIVSAAAAGIAAFSARFEGAAYA